MADLEHRNVQRNSHAAIRAASGALPRPAVNRIQVHHFRRNEPLSCADGEPAAGRIRLRQSWAAVVTATAQQTRSGMHTQVPVLRGRCALLAAFAPRFARAFLYRFTLHVGCHLRAAAAAHTPFLPYALRAKRLRCIRFADPCLYPSFKPLPPFLRRGFERTRRRVIISRHTLTISSSPITSLSLSGAPASRCRSLLLIKHMSDKLKRN